ncbi:hypothetical protein LTR10_000055 [Elasticomyces elasticus]|nr:hypothetical protein LTR10_000055 [Elasticomyces elasticus]
MAPTVNTIIMQTSASVPPSKKHVEALLLRITTLERRLRQYEPQSSKRDLPGLYTVVPDILASPNSPVLSAQPLLDQQHKEKDLTDDLTRLYGHLDIAEDGHLRYFGAPSYFNLPRRPQYQAAPEKNGEDSEEDEDEYHYISSGLDADLQSEVLELFWKWQNPWQYLIHKRMFCDALQKGVYDDYCTPLLLQCILSLGARYSDRIELRDFPDQPETAGNALTNQAKAILHMEVEHPTTSTVAALALLGLRVMSVNQEALGWTYVGMAVRIAYNLGLNHDCTDWVKQGKITEDEAEIRKITWWGCFLLDKLFVVALGRPGMIQQRDVTVAKPSLLQESEYQPWEYRGHNTHITIPASHSASNMQYMCTIFQMSAETLEEM